MGKGARVLLVVVALVVAMLLGARPAAAATFTISGTVTSGGTGNPVANVLVYAYEGGDEAACCTPVDGAGALTSATGSYSITLESGSSYRIRFYPQEGSFVEEWYDGPGGGGTAFFDDATDVTAAATDIDATLAVGSSLTGTVVDETTDDPLEGVGVHAFNPDYEWISGTETDENGAFELFLPAATDYRIFLYSTGANLSEWCCNDAATFEEAEEVAVPADLGEVDLSTGAAITGTVTNSDDEAVEGAYVYAFEAGTCCTWVNGAITDEDGEYSLALPDDGEYVLLFSPPSAAVAQWWDGTADGAPDFESATPIDTATDTLSGKNAVLEAGVTISGTVVDEGGDPLPNVFVGAFTGDVCCTWVTGVVTDEEGDFSLEVPDNGSYKLMFYPFEGASVMEWWDDAANFEAATPVGIGDEDLALGEVELGGGNVISGTVYQADGVTPAEGVYVGAYATPDACGPCTWVAGTGTDANGEYSFSVPDGDYKIMFYPWGSALLAEWYDGASDFESGATVDGSLGDQVLDDVILEEGTAISGVVENESNEPIPGVIVVAFMDDGAGNALWAGGAWTDEQGAYSIVVADASDYWLQFVAPPPYITEWHDGADPFNGDLPPISLPGSETIDATLAAGQTISGTVTDESGEPLAGAYVAAHPSCAELETTSGYAFTDGFGNYSLTVGAGTYILEFVMFGYIGEFYNGLVVCSDEVTTITIAEENIAGKDAALTDGHTVSGTISTGSDGAAAWYVQACDTTSATCFTSQITEADGMYTILLPAGTYTFTFIDFGSCGEAVELEGDVVVTGDLTGVDGVVTPCS